MTPDIRAMTIEDIPDVDAFLRQFPGLHFTETDKPEHVKTYLERNPGLSLVAEVAGQIVGCVMSGHDGRRGTLHKLAALPEHRKHALITRLADEAVKRLNKQDINIIHVYTYSDTEKVTRFFQMFGFKKRDEVTMLTLDTPRLDATD